MIKKLYDKCVIWAGHKYANFLLAFVAFIESSFFPAPPDVMIVPMVVAKREKFLKIALIATIFSVLGGLFGYFIGYVFFNEVGYKIFELYGYENVNILKWINPLEIVKSLNGSGVKPAVKRMPSQEAKPPFVENFSFKKFGSS